MTVRRRPGRWPARILREGIYRSERRGGGEIPELAEMKPRRLQSETEIRQTCVNGAYVSCAAD